MNDKAKTVPLTGHLPAPGPWVPLPGVLLPLLARWIHPVSPPCGSEQKTHLMKETKGFPLRRELYSHCLLLVEQLLCITVKREKVSGSLFLQSSQFPLDLH